MEISITRAVSDVHPDEKLALERIIGKELQPEEHVFICAYTPTLTDKPAAHALSGIEEILSENQKFANEKGMSAADADDAIAEAMRVNRHRT